MSDAEVLARDYLRDETDETGRKLVHELLERRAAGDADATHELAERFGGTLAFGTAGLRGEVGPGTLRMNRVIVSRATWGLGTYLLEQHGDDAKKRGVVVAFDGRRTSRRFAEDTAAVLAGLGIPCHVFPDPVPTPVAAYAVCAKDAVAGVMVTASHNPPADNGYKVYWDNGAQIIPPHDKGIAACIARAPALADMSRPHVADAGARGLRQLVGAELERTYLEAVASSGCHAADDARNEVSIVYTAMHGVGNRFVMRALDDAGFDRVLSVPEQADPDGTFHTVAFPNPEEPGALDLALGAASEMQADLVLANDPDADRIAVVERQPDGGYRTFTGNEVGALLGADALENVDTGGKKKMVITTLVSSTFLSRMAKNVGAAYAETLTGFKWIANTALRAERDDGVAFVFGFEEALGATWGMLVHDKDGVSAAVRVAELKAALKKDGRSLADRLDELAVAHDLSAGAQWSVVQSGAAGKQRIAELMGELRERPFETLGDSPVDKRSDLGRPAGGDGWAASDLPASNVVVFWSADGTRLIVRPSGTEPKIKMYVECAAGVANAAALDDVRKLLDERIASIRKQVDERLGL